MQRRIGNDWYKALWKIVTNPTVEVVAAILLMALSTWIVVQTEVDLHQHPLQDPIVVGPK